VNAYYEADGITIYHGDAMEVAPTVAAEAVVADPPYGMQWDTDTTRFSGGGGGSRARRGVGRPDRGTVQGDDQPFDPSPWLAYKHVILWGLNHFHHRLPPGSALVWLKRNDAAFGSFLSDAELAWKKGGCGVYCFRDLGMAGMARNRVHPTQKPVGLMRWCLGFMPVSATVLDPFMGSGSTLVAAKDMGRRAIGIEIDERYCEIAAKRLSQTVLNLGGVA
jgi:site-specific DNA-methyltransferase (adenine-specific)